MSDSSLPLMYGAVAPWFHLISPPEEYDEEASLILGLLGEVRGQAPKTMLELGSGGGNTASHLKESLETLVLTDLAQPMLDLSVTLNPGLEHIQGDMRQLRLGRTFESVLVHDAIMYMLTPEDLLAAIKTAWEHLEPGGAAIFLPDCVEETFDADTLQGGHDGEGRSARYMEWTLEPEPGATCYDVHYTYMLLEEGQPMQVVHDHHVVGLFSRDTWFELLKEVGFEAACFGDKWGRQNFVGLKPRS